MKFTNLFLFIFGFSMLPGLSTDGVFGFFVLLRLFRESWDHDMTCFAFTREGPNGEEIPISLSSLFPLLCSFFHLLLLLRLCELAVCVPVRSAFADNKVIYVRFFSRDKDLFVWSSFYTLIRNGCVWVRVCVLCATRETLCDLRFISFFSWLAVVGRNCLPLNFKLTDSNGLSGICKWLDSLIFFSLPSFPFSVFCFIFNSIWPEFGDFNLKFTGM